MKTNEELNELKEEVDNLNKNLDELTKEELVSVSGGVSESVYIVRFGDTLASISQTLGVPMSTLVALNGITNPDKLYIGQKLRYPC